MLSYDLANNNFKLKSIVSNKLTNNEIKKICFLKDKQWKFGIKSQIKWFERNIKKYDIHNLLYPFSNFQLDFKFNNDFALFIERVPL